MPLPLFVSRRRLCDRKTLPRAAGDWALDSGGFSELEIHGQWSITAPQYVAEVRRYRDEIGRLQWAPVMDYMCEPWIIAKTGLSVPEHQARTIQSYQQLRDLAPEVPWVPVLQGWAEADYLRHREAYQAAGVELAALPLVGVGTVCRRQHTGQAERIIRQFPDLLLHAFGVKLTGLHRFGEALTSADSMAWSVHARHRPPMYPECTHKNCANCPRWASEWRCKVLDRIEAGLQAPQQLELSL